MTGSLRSVIIKLATFAVVTSTVEMRPESACSPP